MVRQAAVAAKFSCLASRAGATLVQQAARAIIAAATGQRARITREALRAAGAAGCWRSGLRAMRARAKSGRCRLTWRRCWLEKPAYFVSFETVRILALLYCVHMTHVYIMHKSGSRSLEILTIACTWGMCYHNGEPWLIHHNHIKEDITT